MTVSTVALVKYGPKGRETETELLTADNLSVYREGNGLVLSLHEYNSEGKCVKTYRLFLGKADTIRLRSVVGA
jgi:hypothetical protein